MNFFNAFAETLLHSLWQSGLLVMIYVCTNALLQKAHPLQKRNLLYALLGAQFVLSAFTFTVYFSGNSLSDTFSITRQFFGKGNNGWHSSYSGMLFFGYFSIVLFRSGKILYQWINFRSRYTDGLIRPDVELKIFTELKSFHLGIKRKISLWYSDRIPAPVTFGFFKPLILLPFSLVNDLSTAETEAIILHELAHIKSRDYLLNWLLVSMEIIYFFNPFIKIIAGRIRLEREKNCDVQVINFNYSGLLYAEALLKIARSKNAVKPFQLGAVKRTFQLLQRVQFFSRQQNLDFKQHSKGLVVASLLPLFIAFAVFFLPALKIKTEIPAPAEKLYVAASSESLPSKTYGSISEKTAGSFAAIAVDVKDKDIPKVDLPDENFPAIPVAFNETPDSTKEFIYNIETPQGKMTQSFKLVQVKGKWEMQPQWMVMETNPNSLIRSIRDSIYAGAVIDTLQ